MAKTCKKFSAKSEPMLTRDQANSLVHASINLLFNFSSAASWNSLGLFKLLFLISMQRELLVAMEEVAYSLWPEWDGKDVFKNPKRYGLEIEGEAALKSMALHVVAAANPPRSRLKRI